MNTQTDTAPTQALNWLPLIKVPEDRMDGRDTLLWKGGMIVANFVDGWRDAVGRPIEGATHYADVEGPGQ